MTRRRQHAAGWSRLARQGVLAIATTAVAALTIEGLHRTWLWLDGHPYRPAETIAQMHEIADGAAGALRLEGDENQQDELIVLHPYFGYDTQANIERVSLELEAHLSAKDRFDVMILGGSVAAIFAELGSEHMHALLAASPRFAGREIYFLQFARTTYKQPQQQNVLAYLLSLGFRPDVVLNIDGFNEVTLTAHNTATEVHPSYPLGDFWKSVATLGPNGIAGILAYAELARARSDLTAAATSAQSGFLSLSSVLGEWSLGRLHRQQQQLAARTQDYLEGLGDRTANPALFGPEFSGTTGDAVRLGVEMWGESSLSMHAMCKERGIRYLHVLQPTLHDAGSKPMTEQERQTAGLGGLLLDGARLGYPMLRKMGGVLRSQGVAFLDCTAVFAEVRETLYLDACHFNDRGNVILAGAIGPALLEVLPKELPVRTPRMLRRALLDRR